MSNISKTVTNAFSDVLEFIKKNPLVLLTFVIMIMIAFNMKIFEYSTDIIKFDSSLPWTTDDFTVDYSGESSTWDERSRKFVVFVQEYWEVIKNYVDAEIPGDATTPNDLNDASYQGFYPGLLVKMKDNKDTLLPNLKNVTRTNIVLTIQDPNIQGANNGGDVGNIYILGYFLKVYGYTTDGWKNLLETPQLNGIRPFLELDQGENDNFRDMNSVINLCYSGNAFDGQTFMDKVHPIDGTPLQGKGFFIKHPQGKAEPNTGAVFDYPLSREGIQHNRTDTTRISPGDNSSDNINAFIVNKIMEHNNVGTTVTQIRFELWTVISWEWKNGENVIQTYVDMGTSFASGNRQLAKIPIVYIPRPANITVSISDGVGNTNVIGGETGVSDGAITGSD